MTVSAFYNKVKTLTMEGLVLFNDKNEMPHSEMNFLKSTMEVLYPDDYLTQFGHRYFDAFIRHPEDLLDRAVFAGENKVKWCPANCMIYNVISNCKKALTDSAWMKFDLEKVYDDYTKLEFTQALQRLQSARLIELRACPEGGIYLRLRFNLLSKSYLTENGFWKAFSKQAKIKTIVEHMDRPAQIRYLIKLLLTKCIEEVFVKMD